MTTDEHTRRSFLGCAAVVLSLPVVRADSPATSPELARVIDKLEPYFTAPADFQDVSRGTPLPHKLSGEKKREVGLLRDTWKLEVIADPDKPATLGKPLSKKDNTALDFAALLDLGKTRSVRFAKIMTCLNIGCPPRHGYLGRRAAARRGLADATEGEPPARRLPRLPQRRPETTIP